MVREQIFEFVTSFSFGSIFSNQYVFAVLLLGLAIVASLIVLWIFSAYLTHIAGKTQTKFDDIVFDQTKMPIFYLVLFYGIHLVFEHLQYSSYALQTTTSLMAIFFVLILSRSVDAIITTWGETFAKKTKSTIDEVLLPLFHKATKVVFSVIAIMWVLHIWSINITPYLAGVGISGLVLGLALQDSLKNVFGGVSLILDKNFNLGDPIRLESGDLGTVKEIGLRSTKIVTYDNELIFVPNGQLANSQIRNYLKPNDNVRKVVDFSVAYGTDINKVKEVVLKELRKIKGISNDPYMDVIFIEMADFSLKFKARFFVNWSNAYGKWVEANQVVYDALEKNNIEIPFPTRTVYTKKAK